MRPSSQIHPPGSVLSVTRTFRSFLLSPGEAQTPQISHELPRAPIVFWRSGTRTVGGERPLGGTDRLNINVITILHTQLCAGVWRTRMGPKWMKPLDSTQKWQFGFLTLINHPHLSTQV